LLNPVTVNGDDAPVAVKPPGFEVAKYPVMPGGTPVNVGAVNDTVAEASPAVAETLVGAPGPCGHRRLAFAWYCDTKFQTPLNEGIRVLLDCYVSSETSVTVRTSG
jgi:hypothetical protein